MGFYGKDVEQPKMQLQSISANFSHKCFELRSEVYKFVVKFKSS